MSDELEWLVELYEVWGKPEKAVGYRDRLPFEDDSVRVIAQEKLFFRNPDVLSISFASRILIVTLYSSYFSIEIFLIWCLLAVCCCLG